jgi:hypothetical protein
LAFVRGPEGLFGNLTLCCHFSFSPFDFRHDNCCQSDQVITHRLGKTCVVIAPGVAKLLRFLGPMSWYDVVSVCLSCPAWFMDVLLLVVRWIDFAELVPDHFEHALDKFYGHLRVVCESCEECCLFLSPGYRFQVWKVRFAFLNLSFGMF